MKKVAVRLFVALLAFSIGVATIYLFAWNNLKNLNPFRRTHSAENNSPHSVLEGTTVRIKPFEATFQIPESWLTPNPVPTPAKNLHLSHQDLNDLYWNDGSDVEDAKVINSVLPYQNCAAHVGDRGWGNYLWNDLQGRVYITDLTPEEIAAAIESRGFQTALNLFERVSLNSGRHGAWQRRRLDILDAPTHFMLRKNLDFYYRAYGNKTVVFIFLHADRYEEEIDLILNSFTWEVVDMTIATG